MRVIKLNEVYKPKNEYKVIVKTITFNHSKYIQDTLNGTAMQKTNFPFVNVVLEDNSTDGEQDVIKFWIERECDMNLAEYYDIPTANLIIVPHKANHNCTFAIYFHKENLFRQKEKREEQVNPWREKCEYEAMCEGDDYWIDPLKLQKQVDFLETNPEYSMCFHEALVKNETQCKFEYVSLENREYTIAELFNSWIVPTASILHKINVLESVVIDSRIINGDINLVLACAHVGKVFGMSGLMSVYRVQNNGLTIKRATENYIGLQKTYLEHWKCLYANYSGVTYSLYSRKMADTYLSLAIAYWRKSKYRYAIPNLLYAFVYNPFQILRRLFLKIICR